MTADEKGTEILKNWNEYKKLRVLREKYAQIISRFRIDDKIHYWRVK